MEVAQRQFAEERLRRRVAGGGKIDGPEAGNGVLVLRVVFLCGGERGAKDQEPDPGMHSGVATDDALNLSMSEHAVPLFEQVKAFIANEIEPITDEASA